MISGHFAPLIASFLQSGVFHRYDTPSHHPKDPMADDAALVILSSLRNQWNTSLAATARNLPYRTIPFRCESPEMDVHAVRKVVDARYLPLYAVVEPAIPLADYARQLIGGLRCGAECFIMALCLIERLSEVVSVCSLSLHRMLLSAAVVCAKSRDDWYLSMNYYAEVGGVSVSDLRDMEVALLSALRFEVHVPTSTYVSVIHSLRCHSERLPPSHPVYGRWQSILAFIPLPLPELLRRELEAEKTRGLLRIESQTSYETLDDCYPVDVEILHSSLHSTTSVASVGELRQSSHHSSIAGACASDFFTKSSFYESNVRSKVVN